MFRRRGFTLIELMIVVAIIGILAAVAVPMFLKYIRDAKTTEAQEQLKAIGEGALSHFNVEINGKADSAMLKGGGGVTTETGQYPNTAQVPASDEWQDCTTTGNIPGQKQVPLVDDFQKWPWRVLRFEVLKPHYYQYCYSSDDVLSFTATARASLTGGAAASTSVFELLGVVQRSDGHAMPILGMIEDVSP